MPGGQSAMSTYIGGRAMTTGPSGKRLFRNTSRLMTQGEPGDAGSIGKHLE